MSAPVETPSQPALKLPAHAFQPRMVDAATAVFLVKRTDEGPARIAEIRKLADGKETVLLRIAPVRCRVRALPTEDGEESLDDGDEGDRGEELDLLWPDDFSVENGVVHLRLKDGEPPDLMLDLRVPLSGGTVERKLTGDCRGNS